MRQILSLTRKELEGYFGSPLALIFLGAFLIAELFIFFSIETFFARGIADVRPMFQWMPILLIFLLAALTMRQWSEEQRSGTLEVLLTLPVDHIKLVVGKFLAVMVIISLALALTLPLPITVSLLGNLDWGPVIGGYLAALLMAAAYAAIGLFMSSRTDNQIVALITTALVGGLFYLAGVSQITDFFGGSLSEVLWGIGTGSRFESIERGVIDLRDLIYYLSLTGIFLTLNTLSLDSLRWSKGQVSYQRKIFTTTVLIALNLLLINVWLFPLQGLRLDLTAQKEYTLSQASKDLLDNLQEPLVIQGYISENSHPLLLPLVPQIRDLLREYEIASGGMITSEVFDPIQFPDLESEANQTYGISPMPFQVTSRYETSVINAYFDILVRYGDQFVVLNFRDLIEIEQGKADITVRLRNLEYDLTRAIKKVVYGFQSVDAVLAELDEPVRLTLYTTPESLPEWLLETDATFRKVATEIQGSSDGKLLFQVINPDDPASLVNRQSLYDLYGLQPIPADFFGTQTYYLHAVLENEDQIQVIYPSGELAEADVRTSIESSIKRTSSGFLKTVGLWTPPQVPTQDMFGQVQQPLSSYQLINEHLRQEYTVQQIDLTTGQIPSNIDVVVVVAPQNLGEKEQFTIDQYLMRGGSVIIATGNGKLAPDQFSGALVLEPVDTGIKEMLTHYGVTISDATVMDPQNQPFPVVINRNVGGFQVQEIQAIDYPYFVDVYPDGMNTDSPIVSNLPAVTLNWVSTVELDEIINATRETNTLLYSSENSWLRNNIDIQPNFEIFPDLGFAVEGQQTNYPLAVSIQGSFESFFKGKPTPFQDPEETGELTGEGPQQPQENIQTSVVENSPDTARLVVIGSASFVDDFVLELSSRLSQERYLNNLLFLQNAVDWSVEDLDLLTIRARGAYTRVLNPLEDDELTRWEILNYGIAIIALVGLYVFWQVRKRREEPMVLPKPEDFSVEQ